MIRLRSALLLLVPFPASQTLCTHPWQAINILSVSSPSKHSRWMNAAALALRPGPHCCPVKRQTAGTTPTRHRLPRRRGSPRVRQPIRSMTPSAFCWGADIVRGKRSGMASYHSPNQRAYQCHATFNWRISNLFIVRVQNFKQDQHSSFPKEGCLGLWPSWPREQFLQCGTRIARRPEGRSCCGSAGRVRFTAPHRP